MDMIKNLLAGFRQSCDELLDLPIEADLADAGKGEVPVKFRIWGAFLLVVSVGVAAILVAVFAKVLLPPVGAAVIFAALMLIIFEVKDSGKASRSFGRLFAGWTCGKFGAVNFVAAATDDVSRDEERESIVALWLSLTVKFILFAYICYSGKLLLAAAFFAADVLTQLWLIYGADPDGKIHLRTATALLVLLLMCFQIQVVFFSAAGIFFFFRALRKITALPPEGVTLAGNISGWIVLLFALVFSA